MFEATVLGDDEIEFVLRRAEVVLRKRYVLDLERYAMELSLTVENNSSSAVSPTFEIAWRAEVVTNREEQDYLEEGLLVRNAGEVERRLLPSVGSPGFLASWFGGAEEGPEEFGDAIEWLGVELKYFVSVLIPDEPSRATASLEAIRPGHSAQAVLRFLPVMVEPGQSHTRKLNAFLGPKRHDELAVVESSLIETIDLGYSWFVPLTRFFQWLLNACYAIIPNFGWAIILITIGVRILTWPIMARQMKSMERMRALQPRLKEIQEKFKDDRQKQSEEMMKLYKETGVNPLGGCFPMLLQFPVFIGLFFALRSSIDLRHAPFMLWIDDLSAPEVLFTLPGVDFPLRVLPVLMGASMLIQQRMTPMTGMDPAQAKMMMTVMPIMMMVLFYQFPSGLVLYWMVSNILGIAHQLWVRKNMQAAE